MFDLINELSELVYIVDRETYEILYMNNAGKSIFGIKDPIGTICYQTIQGKDEPCEFCTNHCLKEHTFYTWEYTNPLLGRHFLLKDSLIDYNGQQARIEIAFDTTKSENEKQALKHALDAENLVVNCAKILYSASDGTPIDSVLAIIGEFLEAQYACIFEITNSTVSHIRQWHTPANEVEASALQHLDDDALSWWRDTLASQKCVHIENIEDLEPTNPWLYNALHTQDIQSLVLSPMTLDGQLLGYMGICNYAVGKINNVGAILGSLSYFIGSVLRHQQTLRQLERLSYYDTLTGMLNRNAFVRDIVAPKSTCTDSIGIIYIDINGMKQLNDHHGHQMGDSALKDAAAKIMSIFADYKTYRIGGDEFVIICQSISQKCFGESVRDLKNHFNAHSDYTVSIGDYWTESCSDIQEALFQADEKMYQDKKSFYQGKALSGRYRRSTDDLLGMTEPGALEQMITEGKFLIYYQPKMATNEPLLIGSEALVRCQITPEKLLSPAIFIPILEEARLISVLDFYVFGTVCRQLKRWLAQGRLVAPVSVNFSRYTLSEPGFAQRLHKLWQQSQLPKSLLEIEVTETAEACDSYDFLTVIKTIKANGFAISIDDFGVKSANLSLFTAMDFDVLKIDKSLIQDINHNAKSQAVLTAITEICRKMHIKLIVEGVETQAQFDLIKKLGCEGVQGFLFSKPLPLEQFEARYLSSPKA